jgi:Kef-type K+ transport system membrane component KefB
MQGIPTNVQVPDVPDAMRLWKEQKNYMHIWLAGSIFSCIFFFPLYVAVGIFFPALVASILGIICSSMYLCACWSTDLATQVKMTVVMGSIAAIMDAWNMMLAFLIISTVTCGEGDCRALVSYIIFFSVFLGCHGWVSYYMVKQARTIVRVMNPISSGLVAMGV